jgi:hypothetical protein
MRFCGVTLRARAGCQTIWLFREQLTRPDATEYLFQRFDAALRAGCYLMMGGQIVDATVVQARRPKLSKDEGDRLRILRTRRLVQGEASADGNRRPVVFWIAGAPRAVVSTRLRLPSGSSMTTEGLKMPCSRNSSSWPIRPGTKGRLLMASVSAISRPRAKASPCNRRNWLSMRIRFDYVGASSKKANRLSMTHRIAKLGSQFTPIKAASRR